MKNKNVFIQMVNYNGLSIENDIFKKSIESVLKQTYKNIVFHIIDNNSSDNSVDFIKQNYPSVRLKALKKNYGYTAHNMGIKDFLSIDADYIILLNNDIILAENTIEQMVLFMDNDKNIGLSSPIIKMLNKEDYINSTGLSVNYIAFTENNNYGIYEKFAVNKNISAISGAFMVLRRSILESIGLFDSIYFAYYEDVDLSLRILSETDYKIAINNNAVCYHNISSSWDRINKRKNYLLLRNQYIILLKLFPMDLLIFSFVYFIKTRFMKRIFLHIKIFTSIFIHSFDIVLKRFRHISRSKRSIKKFLIKTYKPFPMEIKYKEYARTINNIEGIDEKLLSEDIVFGINDYIIGNGFSFLDSVFPIGRFINGNATIYIKNSQSKYFNIHGVGNGELYVNEEKLIVNEIFSIYIPNTLQESMIKIDFYTNDRIKIIGVYQVNEKV